MQSLYVHFPFCEAKCHYCDFYSLGKNRTQADDPRRFEQALYRESVQTGHLLSPQLDTLFFGGGTPSMTPPDAMARALEPLWERTRLSDQVEWTIEANPSSISLESFRDYRQLGVNRISMGVQSLHTELLKSLGRVHTRETALKSLQTVFEAGFDNVSVDLLCGVPDQSEKDLAEALEILTSFPITHLSCYLLTLPPHHKMFSSLPHEDVQLEHLLFIHDWMTEKGFEHYEISNFAKPGKRAQHNLRYWKNFSYLGLGPSAHSFDATHLRRWKNVSSLHKYSSLLEKGESVVEGLEQLTSDQIEIERWMLALRLDEGFPVTWLQTPEKKLRSEIFEEKGLLEVHPLDTGRRRLTPRGFALSDQVISAFV